MPKVISLIQNESRPLPDVNDSLPLRITPYYGSLLHATDPSGALRRTVIPVSDEFVVSPGETSDPFSEGHDSPVPNLVHRYPDRVLSLSTGFCSTCFRYRTRSYLVASDKCNMGIKAWQPAFDYIRSHPEIRDC